MTATSHQKLILQNELKGTKKKQNKTEYAFPCLVQDSATKMVTLDRNLY